MRYWSQRTCTQRYNPFFLSLAGPGNPTEDGAQNIEGKAPAASLPHPGWSGPDKEVFLLAPRGLCIKTGDHTQRHGFIVLTIQIHFQETFQLSHHYLREHFNFLNRVSVYPCPWFVNIFLATLHIPNPLFAREGEFCDSYPQTALWSLGREGLLGREVCLDNSHRPS